jgi:ATP-dependent Clp protease ATP-binding subunit ClpA
MFERFSADARATVHLAQAEAQQLGSAQVDSGHFLLALVADTTGPAGRALRASHLNLDDVRDKVRKRAGGLDPDALAAIGIDLEAVRQATEATFGPGALDAGPPSTRGRVPFSGEAKKLLELSLRMTLSRKSKSITSGDVLLAALNLTGSVAVQVLGDARVNIESLRVETAREIAAQPT